jgi:hypothetical protein
MGLGENGRCPKGVESPDISVRKDGSRPKLEPLTQKYKSDTLTISETMAIGK